MRKTLSTAGALTPALALALLAGCTAERTPPPAITVSTAPPAAGLPNQNPESTVFPTSGPLTTAGAAIVPTTAPTPTSPAPVPPNGRPAPPVEAVRNAWISATVTRGGSGPCFTLTGSDGKVYATYSAKALRLTTGARVRARITPGKTPVSCGTGSPARLEHLELAG
jgi:hypothetical protein